MRNQLGFWFVSFLSAALLQLAGPGGLSGLLIFISFVPAFFWLDGARPAYWAAMPFVISLLSNVDQPIATIGWGTHLSLISWIGVAALNSFVFWISAAVVSSFKLRPAVVIFIVPLSWSVVSTLSEPLLSLPLSLSVNLSIDNSALIAPARLVGSSILDGVILSISALTASLLKLKNGVGFGLLSVWVLVLVWAAFIQEESNRERLSSLETLKMALVQPAISQRELMESRNFLQARNRREALLDDLTSQAISAGAEIVVWPEGGNGVYNTNLQRRVLLFSRMLTDSSTELLIASSNLSEVGIQQNSVFHVSASGVGKSASKSVRVPFTESHIQEGEPTVLATKYGRLGIAICYEGVFRSHFEQLVDLDAEIVVITSNDTSFGQTRLPILHAAYAILRGIESEVPIVFLSNNGVALATDARGKVIDADWQGKDSKLIWFDVPLISKRSAYILILSCAWYAGILVCLVVMRMRFRRI